MIIIKLGGGLGNQMFQYACGRALQLRRAAKGKQEDLKLDVSGYRIPEVPGDPRPYALGAFSIRAGIATAEEVRSSRYPFGILSKALRYAKAKLFRDFNIGWKPRIFSSMSGSYLDGYWQTERYFEDFAAEIRKDFALKTPLAGVARDWQEKISHDPYAVSLHIRRGDYVSHKDAAATMGAQGIEYYLMALESIQERVAKPQVYVFSDDIAWAKENLKPNVPLAFVSSPALKPHEEMMLMSSAKHHIIANSTFSWWGAWLGGNPDKIVIAPRRWAHTGNDSWYLHTVPNTWTRL